MALDLKGATRAFGDFQKAVRGLAPRAEVPAQTMDGGALAQFPTWTGYRTDAMRALAARVQLAFSEPVVVPYDGLYCPACGEQLSEHIWKGARRLVLRLGRTPPVANAPEGHQRIYLYVRVWGDGLGKCEGYVGTHWYTASGHPIIVPVSVRHLGLPNMRDSDGR